ncbi:MAG: CDP-alcohol phosphatidyltransferase family protein [Eggerthellaceae bacterium]|jgi:CDP-diacylglycerol--glycerol-3-phosphate 3-phosphatidyltransferase|nr:CDP-alcohol phosphatidyltransferase family protein [Eggerthellaceae bacterium]MDR2716361.1 CDP-alcohol phosphatidyltransferase family protein [Coriobacteriaceae bacterium]
MSTGLQTRFSASLPSALTASRIVAALALLFTEAFSSTFLVIYLWCGASDVLDGILARRLRQESDFGAKLDSLADLVFSAVLLLVLIRTLTWRVWMYLILCLVVLVRLAALAIAALRFRTFASLHSWANKSAGIFLFLLPALYLLWGLSVAVLVVGLVCLLAATEELILVSRMEELDLNTRGLALQKRSPGT